MALGWAVVWCQAQPQALVGLSGLRHRLASAWVCRHKGSTQPDFEATLPSVGLVNELSEGLMTLVGCPRYLFLDISSNSFQPFEKEKEHL